ncbi:MAG: tRNA1(Val) (adenine(37)-N6)-methyltransferase [Bacillota bacterium]
MNEFPLLPGERAVDLQYNGLFILQSAKAQGVGTDSVLLANFTRLNAKERAVDLGCGTGLICLLLASRTGARITGVELIAETADMARRSAMMNGIINVSILCSDLNGAPKELGCGKFDAVVSNPPFFTVGTVSPDPFRAAARHDVSATLKDIATSASALLKNGGRFTMIYPSASLCDALTTLREHALEPKRLRFVASRADRPPRRALIEAKKGASAGLIVEPLLVMHDASGAYTDEMNRIYHIQS